MVNTELKIIPVIVNYAQYYKWMKKYPLTPRPKKLLGKYRRVIKKIAQGLNEKSIKGTVIEKIEIVESYDDIKEIRNSLIEADALLIFNAGGACQPLIMKLAELKTQIILYGKKNFPGPEIMEVYESLKDDIDFISLAFSEDDLVREISILNTLKRFKNSTIIIFGSPAAYLVGSIWDPRKVTRKLGIKVKRVRLHELLEKFDSISGSSKEVKNLSRKVIKGAKNIININKRIKKETLMAVRYYLAIKKIVEQMGADAFTINCFDCADLMYEKYHEVVMPCLALSLFRDDGIPAGCEGDVNALLSMMILSNISGKPAFMGNITLIDPKNDVIRLAHCTAPRKMKGYRKRSDPYNILDLHETKKGFTLQVVLKKNEKVTMARLGNDLDEISVRLGKVLTVNDQAKECCTRIKIKLNNAALFAENSLGNHQAIVYGDYVKEVLKICEMLNIKDVYRKLKALKKRILTSEF